MHRDASCGVPNGVIVVFPHPSPRLSWCQQKPTVKVCPDVKLENFAFLSGVKSLFQWSIGRIWRAKVHSTSTSSFEGALLRLQLLAAEIAVLLHQAHVRWNYHTHWLMLPFPGHVCRIGNLFSTSPFLFPSGDWWPSMEPLFYASWVSYRLPLFSVDLYLFKCFLYSSWISQFQSSNTMGDFEVSTGSFNKTLKLGTVHICQQGSSSYTPGGLTYHILRHCALSRFSGLHVEC